MELPKDLSPIIQEIIDVEIAAGNSIKNIIIEGNGIIGIETTNKISTGRVVTKVEKNYDPTPLREHTPDFPKIGKGFTDSKTGHYIQYVERIRTESPYDFLSPALHPLLDMELKLGNKIHSAEAWTWTKVPYEVFMKFPLHTEAAKKLINHEQVEYSFNEARPWMGAMQQYICLKTNHMISSPYITEEK